MATLARSIPGTTAGTKQKRSWLMTFADVLLQLLAFFIMRVAIAPHPPQAILNGPKGAGEGRMVATRSEPTKKLPGLHLLKFHRVSSDQGMQAELSKNSLPDSLPDISFSMKEDLRTLGLAFGAGDYVLTLNETVCSRPYASARTADAISPSASIVFRALLASGVRADCLQVGSSELSADACPGDGSDGETRLGVVKLLVRERQCEPFVN